MANLNCEACDELRQEDPSLILNGFSESECTSLMNDTGLVQSSGHNDCTDLNNMNDCMVGNMATEVSAHDVCDWKPFMKKFINNLWTVEKAIICAICGIWTNIHNLWNSIAELWDAITNIWNRISALCEMINATISPGGIKYGIFPRNPDQAPRTCGTIATKNGRPALIDGHQTSHNADLYTGVGLRWGTVRSISCPTGEEITRSFWKPYIWGYLLNKDLEIGDVLWYVPKSTIMGLIPQMTEDWWYMYTVESWVWSQHRLSGAGVTHKNVWLRFHVGDEDAGISTDYLVLTYVGTSYPSETPSDDALITEGDPNEVRWG